VTGQREDGGFCGVWLNFHPRSEAPREYLDAGSFPYLSFWAKGAKGGEEFEIELTDEESSAEDAKRPRRSLRTYLPGGLAKSWREVVIPLADFRGIDPRRLVRMTISIVKRGDFRFHVDDVAFKREASTVVPAPPGRKTAASSGNAHTVHRAMWVWNTQPLFDRSQPEEADRFFAFCSRNRVRELYLAAEFAGPDKEAAPLFEIRTPDGYREFLTRAHREGLKVEALAGTPEWGVGENFAQALAHLEGILAFNRANGASARFDGVHFDVEPYALIGYSDPQYRPRILVDFLEMVAKVAARTRAEGLRFSCDVPAWFYPAGGLERHRLVVPFQGAEKTVGEHLTDLLESVTIMDYTNQADGTGGIIARALPALAYAASRNKRVVVGLETFSEPKSVISFVCGLPGDEFWPRLAAAGLRNQLFFEGFRISVCSDDVNVHIGLSAPRELAPEQRQAYEVALARLARQLGASSNPERFPAAPMVDLARAALAGDPEWVGFEPFEFKDPETGQLISGFRTSRRMQPGITFAGLGREVFEEEFNSAVQWLSTQPSFGGMAIHFYESFRDLLEGK
jgi:hypothetical protein